MREGWKEYKLKELLEIKYGKDHKKLKDGKYPLFGSGGIMRYVDEYLYNDESILIPRKGTLSNLFYLNSPFSTVDTMFWTKIDKERVFPKFLYYLLKTYDLSLLDVGAAIPSLTTKALKEVLIRIPESKETQRQIASILSAYDDLIENNLKRIKLLEEQAQQTYEEWFVRFKFPGHETAEFDEESGLPVGWEIASLNDVSRINSKSLKKDFEGKIKYIDIASVSTGEINSTTSYNISDAPGRAKRIVKHGDIIWSCVRPNRKSYSVIWNPEQNLIASTGFCVITPKTLPTSYLLKYLTTDSYVAYLSNLAGGAAYPAVKAVDFKNSDVIIPEKSLIEKYDSIFKNSLELSSNLQAQNQLLKEARDILLPRLMMGIIDPSASSVDDVEWVDSDSYLKAAEERSNYKKST